MSQQASSLSNVLQNYLIKMEDAKILMLSTYEGVELLTVARDNIANETNIFDKQSLDLLVLSFAGCRHQAAKLGVGEAQHTIIWTDHGILVHVKADALVLSLVMEETANLGLLDEHISTVQKILAPFSSANFLNVTL